MVALQSSCLSGSPFDFLIPLWHHSSWLVLILGYWESSNFIVPSRISSNAISFRDGLNQDCLPFIRSHCLGFARCWFKISAGCQASFTTTVASTVSIPLNIILLDVSAVSLVFRWWWRRLLTLLSHITMSAAVSGRRICSLPLKSFGVSFEALYCYFSRMFYNCPFFELSFRGFKLL